MIPNGDIVFVMDGICERRPPRLRLWRHQESELIDIDIGPRAPLISFEEVRFYRNSYGSFLVFTSSCRDESMKYPLKLHAFDMEGSGDWLEGSEFGIYLVPGTPRSVVVYGDMLLLAFENQRMIIQGFELIQLGNKFVDTDKHFVSETLYDFLLEPEESGPRKAGHSMLATGNKIYLVGCVAGCKTGETGFWIGIYDPHSDGNKLKFRSGIIDLPLRTSQPIISAFDDGELVLLMGGKPVNYKKGFSFDRRMCIMKTGTGRYLCLLQDVVPDFGTSIEENRITSADFVTFPTEFGLRNATLVRWSNSSFQAVYLGYFLDPGEILRDSTKRTTQYALTTSIISNNGENTMIIPSTTTPDLFGIRFSELAGQPFERSALFFILTTLAILIFFGTLFLVYSSARRRLEAKKKNSEKITSTRLSTLGTSKVSIRDEESPNEDHTKTEMSSFTNASTLMTLGRTLAIPGFLMLLQDVDFEVGGQINEGAGGKISSCRIKSTGEECILKTIKAMKDADSEDMRTIFFQEVATMWLFKDSFYVLKLVGYCPEPMGIITKKCQYGSLSALIHENVDLWHETDWDNIVYSVANDVAHGMNEIHSTGLVHSDIKPDNILFDPVPTSPYHVVICDFGVATVVDESLKRVNEMKLSRLIGASLIYSAPEVLSLMNQLSQLLERSDPTILKAADVYAYAVTLYETVAKVQPYGGIPSSSIQEMVLKGQRPVLPPAVIKRVKDPRVRKIVNVINSAWTQDPEMRPSFQRIIDMLQ